METPRQILTVPGFALPWVRRREVCARAPATGRPVSRAAKERITKDSLIQLRPPSALAGIIRKWGDYTTDFSSCPKEICIRRFDAIILGIICPNRSEEHTSELQSRV